MSSIIKDLQELVSHKVISADTAHAIEGYYAAKKQPQGNGLLAVFGILGAILVGLGIILIFAHNWDNFSRTAKVAVAFLPLIAFQGLAAYTIIKKKNSAWRNSAALLLFFSVGSAIALVAQIYNIPGGLDTFLCTWITLGLPLVYVLRSNALALLLVVFATYYTQASYRTMPWPYLLFIAALIPHYIQLIRNNGHAMVIILLNWLLPLSFISTLVMFVKEDYLFSLPAYAALFFLLFGIGTLPYFKQQRLRINGYLCLGTAGMVVLLIISSFTFVWQLLTWEGFPEATTILFIAVPTFMAIALAAYNYSKHQTFMAFQFAFLLFAIIYGLAFLSPDTATVVANLAVLATGIGFIYKGINQSHFGLLNFGLLIIAILTTCRFFDTDMSFAIRGLLFVLVGIGFFAANYFLAKKKKNTTLNTVTHEN